jgi:hypothetical protein
VWGFDSFVGLGEEDPEVSRYAKTSVSSTWTRGAYSASAALHLPPSYALAETITRHISGTKFKKDPFAQRLSFVSGFYNETLTRTLARERGMRPAIYIDIDVDQYLPTKQALRWLFQSGLIANGTLIGYDDFGNTPMWVAGESRAHIEIAHEFNVAFQLHSSECATFCKYSAGSNPCGGNNFHPIFRVLSVGRRGKVC